MGERVKTVHLGQFTHEHAEAIAGKLEGAGIVWWYKQPGYFSSIWEKGVRLFVDEKRLAESQDIARSVLAEGPEAGSAPEQG
ncbi:MAG: hypothetical protein ACRDLB_07370 [Actinomycetota bacterium]